MDRDTWITAARMVALHGADAFSVVESMLEEMRGDRVTEDDFKHWCWIARAVLEIIREEPLSAEAIH